MLQRCKNNAVHTFQSVLCALCMKPPNDFSNFPEIENNSAVSTLIELVEQQSVTIQQQGEVIQLLREEIARLKGQKPKPKINTRE